MNQIKNTVIKT